MAVGFTEATRQEEGWLWLVFDESGFTGPISLIGGEYVFRTADDGQGGSLRTTDPCVIRVGEIASVSLELKSAGLRLIIEDDVGEPVDDVYVRVAPGNVDPMTRVVRGGAGPWKDAATILSFDGSCMIEAWRHGYRSRSEAVELIPGEVAIVRLRLDADPLGQWKPLRIGR